jgi:O-antigen/teichoic acid export membrane protein
MSIATYVNIKNVDRFSKDPLFRNSFFMLINKGLVVITGFVFWILAARYYSVNDIGIATALLSGSSLIVAFSSLGFEVSLVRFLKSYDKSKAFYTCLFMVIGTSFCISLLYIFFVQYITPDLSFIKEWLYGIVFTLFTVISAIAIITNNTFWALRDARYTFLQNLLQISRVPALIPLMGLGILGIIGANFFGYIITYIAIFIILARFIPFKPQLDMGFIKKSFKFSFGNYIANIMYNASFLALPIIVLNLKGDAAAGIFYIAFTLGNFLLQIPIALSVSFFVEGVYGENLRKNLVKSGTAILLLLVPGIALFWSFGPNILGFFGDVYVNSIDLLRLVALSSLVYAVYSLFQPILNIRMCIKALILLNLMIMILLVGLSYLFISIAGISGVGYAMICTFSIVDIAIIYLAIRWGWLSLKPDIKKSYIA